MQDETSLKISRKLSGMLSRTQASRPRTWPRTRPSRPRPGPRTEGSRPRPGPRTQHARPRPRPRTEGSRPRPGPRTCLFLTPRTEPRTSAEPTSYILLAPHKSVVNVIYQNSQGIKFSRSWRGMWSGEVTVRYRVTQITYIQCQISCGQSDLTQPETHIAGLY